MAVVMVSWSSFHWLSMSVWVCGCGLRVGVGGAAFAGVVVGGVECVGVAGGVEGEWCGGVVAAGLVELWLLMLLPEAGGIELPPPVKSPLSGSVCVVACVAVVDGAVAVVGVDWMCC